KTSCPKSFGIPSNCPSWIGGVAAAKPQTGWLFNLQNIFVIEQPPRRFATPLLSRRGNRPSAFPVHWSVISSAAYPFLWLFYDSWASHWSLLPLAHALRQKPRRPSTLNWSNDPSLRWEANCI